MRFTDRTIAALPAPSTGQKLYADDALSGFGLRVSHAGTKAFVLTVGVERRRITIGRYPIVTLAQAREKARTLLAKRQLGLEKPLSPRLDELREEFLSKRQDTLRATSYRKDVGRLKVFAPLSKKRVAEIEPEEVQAILDRMPAPSTRHEAYVRFKLLIRFALKKRYLQHWPLDALDGEFERRSRERVLTDEELVKVLHTARIWRLGGHHFGTIIELLILTGQRRQQIGSLARSHVDFDNDTITWPPELMKAGRKHIIPMGAAVKALLAPKISDLYFPNKYREPFSFAGAHDRAFRADCGFADWVLHDLRRTMATRWQEMGIDITTTEKMLSHSALTGGLVGIYQRSTYLAQMREAVHRWEEYIEALASTTEGTLCLTPISPTSSLASASG